MPRQPFWSGLGGQAPAATSMERQHPSALCRALTTRSGSPMESRNTTRRASRPFLASMPTHDLPASGRWYDAWRNRGPAPFPAPHKSRADAHPAGDSRTVFLPTLIPLDDVFHSTICRLFLHLSHSETNSGLPRHPFQPNLELHAQTTSPFISIFLAIHLISMLCHGAARLHFTPFAFHTFTVIRFAVISGPLQLRNVQCHIFFRIEIT